MAGTRALTLALDIGGTKIAAALVDGGRILRQARVATPSGDAEAVWAAVVEMVTGLAAGASIAVVGAGCAGPSDAARAVVAPLNIPGWRTGFPLRARLAALVGVPVAVAGDALCMALGEHRHGAGTGSRALLGMVVSTGVGGGLVIEGAPWLGRTGNAGHVGHVVVEPDGPACGCGGRGCLETVAAGSALVRWARQRGWRGDTAQELAAAAAAGDTTALAAFERGGTAVGIMIAGVAAVCDLDRVVIGGGVARAGALLFDPVRRAVRRHARCDYLAELEVRPAALGADAGLVGAAALAGEPGAAG